MADDWNKVLVLILVFAAIVMVIERLLGAMIIERVSGRAVNQRLNALAKGASRTEAMGMLRRQATMVPGYLPPWVAKPALAIEKTLMAAGTALPVSRLLVILLAAPLAILLLFVLSFMVMNVPLTLGRLFLLAAASVAIGTAIPLFYFQFRASRRRRKFQEQFPVALDVFVRGLRAGHPIAAALDLLTTEMPDPVGSEFGLVVDEVTYGAELKDALSAMADRWDMDDIRMFVVSLAVQNETGGNLAEILENLSRVIRERASMMLKVRALSSEGRMTAWMLSGLPVATFLVLFMLNPGFYLDVADDPWFIPGFGTLIGMYVSGVIMIRRMIDLKV